MKFGLSDQDMEVIAQMISACDEIDKAILFGSRAKGNHKPGSDIDIAIFGDNIDIHVISKLHSLLEDQGPLPYLFDVVDGTHLAHQALKEHIERVGQVIFVRSIGS
jgi:predicted nucleotidyltransferase